MNRQTIACPAKHMDIANHYAMALGYSEADGMTYRNPYWQDAGGNLYACASQTVGDAFISTATSPLVRPAWDTDNVVDLTKASQAQALVALWMPEDGEPILTASPDQITAIMGMDGLDAIAAMGLTIVEVGPDDEQ